MADKTKKLGKAINGVLITYRVKDGVNPDSDVTEDMYNFMCFLLQPKMKEPGGDKEYHLNSVCISSTSEACKPHKPGGPHRSGIAVDISRINEKGITTSYDTDMEVRCLSDALQIRAFDYPTIVDNFGPLALYKSSEKDVRPVKNEKLVSLHKTHLHFSVRA